MSPQADGGLKYTLIIKDIRGDPPVNVFDYRDIKDFIRGLMTGQPGLTNVVRHDRAMAICDMAMCDFDTWHEAFEVFTAINGHEWYGTRLEAILQYPDTRTWLIHPSTDPSQSTPLVRRYRTNSGLGYPFLVPQLSRGHRNDSISSLSSQTSSQGGPTTPSSLDSPGTPQYQAPTFAVVDTTSGATIPPHKAHLLAASHPNSNGRYQTFLIIADAGRHSPQSPRSPLARLQFQFQTEQRSIMMRELNVHATEQDLRDLFVARNVPAPSGLPDIRRPERNRRCHALVTFSTAADAREAVRRLNNCRFMDRTLEVVLAQDGTTVPAGQRPIIADGSI